MRFLPVQYSRGSNLNEGVAFWDGLGYGCDPKLKYCRRTRRLIVRHITYNKYRDCHAFVLVNIHLWSPWLFLKRAGRDDSLSLLSSQSLKGPEKVIQFW